MAKREREMRVKNAGRRRRGGGRATRLVVRGDDVAVGGAALDVDLDRLAALLHLGAAAAGAHALGDLALAAALVARGLHLLHEAGRDLRAWRRRGSLPGLP